MGVAAAGGPPLAGPCGIMGPDARVPQPAGAAPEATS